MHRRIPGAHRVIGRENGRVGDGEIQRLLRGEFKSNNVCKDLTRPLRC